METVTELENGIFEIRAKIVQLFVVMLGRAPGSAELDDYLHAVEGGATMEQLADDIAATPLFNNIFSESLTNFKFADQFLTMVFGGEIAADTHLWAVVQLTAMLDTGQSRASVAFLVAKALNEIEPGHPAYEDFEGAIVRLDNQVAVAEYYSTKLPDSTGSDLILADVTSDPATREAGFAAVDALARRGELFTFTSGVDQLQGTDRDDVFMGVLSPRDQIDGGDGFDIIELGIAEGDLEIPELVSVSGIEVLTVNATGAFSGDISEWAGLEYVVANGVSSVSVEIPENSTLLVNSDSITDVNVIGTELFGLQVSKSDNFTPSDTLESVTVSGDVGLFMGVTGMNALRTIDASGTSGANTLFVAGGDALESIYTGSGRDYVAVTADHRADGFSVDLGAGNDLYLASSRGGINSAISGGEGKDDLYILFGEFSESVNSEGDSVTTLRLSGRGRLEISDAPTTVTYVQAREAWWGGVAVGVPGAIGSITFSGSSADDDFTGGIGDDVFRGRNGADTLNGNAGADSFHGGRGADTLNGGAGSDVYLYIVAEESLLSSSDYSGTRASFDTIVNLDNDPNGDKDFIQLFTGLVSQDELNRGLLRKDPLPYLDNGNKDEADPVQDLLDYIGDGEGFFSDGANDYAIAVVDGGPAHKGFFVFIDVNDDGDFDATTEMVIQILAGNIDASSFTIHPGPIIIS